MAEDRHETENTSPDYTEQVISPDELLQRFGLAATAEVEAEEKEAEEETSAPAAEAEVEVLEEEAPVEVEEETAEVEVEVELGELPEPESGEWLPDPFAILEEDVAVDKRDWFVIHCYSGYEQKVKHNLEQRIESMDMPDFIFQVVVPTVEEIEIKDGKRRHVERCLYPGYIMVQMVLTDDSWYVVRNTPGVTGFVGMGNKPVPLRPEQVQNILRRMEAEAPQIRATFRAGQKVRIIEGPFADFIGVVEEIDEERTKVRVLVSFFGRETPVELDFLQVEKT